MWFVFVVWGLELGVVGAFRLVGLPFPADSFLPAFALLVVIVSLRSFAIVLLLRWLKIGFSELFGGGFGLIELALSILVALTFTGLEVAYSHTYSLQALQEFGHFLKISGNYPEALLLFGLQYAYYFVEVTAVNLLYVGGRKLGNERTAFLLPALLWGFAHSINALFIGPIPGLLLGVYAGLFALITYYLAWRRGSLKLAVFTWFLNLIL